MTSLSSPLLTLLVVFYLFQTSVVPSKSVSKVAVFLSSRCLPFGEFTEFHPPSPYFPLPNCSHVLLFLCLLGIYETLCSSITVLHIALIFPSHNFFCLRCRAGLVESCYSSIPSLPPLTLLSLKIP